MNRIDVSIMYPEAIDIDNEKIEEGGEAFWIVRIKTPQGTVRIYTDQRLWIEPGKRL